MKKTLLLMVLGLACCLAGKSIAAATAPVAAVTSAPQGAVLDVDGDYTWKALVEDKGLVFGTPEFRQARLACIAYGDAVKDAQDASKAGDYAKAESLALTWCTKAFYGLNHLRKLMGGSKGDAGYWTGYAVKADGKKELYSGPDSAAIKAEFTAVDGYVRKAIADGKTKDSRGNDVSTVAAYLAGYRTGILSAVLQ